MRVDKTYMKVIASGYTCIEQLVRREKPWSSNLVLLVIRKQHIALSQKRMVLAL
jgi:hypothetical protein